MPAAGAGPRERSAILVPIPETSELGPRMRECTAMERKFIYALTICGGRGIDAALAAGYGDKSNTREQREDAARQAAHALMTRDRVLEAIAEEAKKRLRAGALLAADKLIVLLDDPSLSKKDQVRAAIELLDRGGLVVQQKVEITHKTEREEQVVAEITRLAKNLGLDPARLLGQTKPVVIDAEFEVIKESTRDPVTGSASGLEDLL